MASLKETVLQAAKADAIPAGGSGLWTVKKFSTSKPLSGMRDDERIVIPPGNYTQLFCYVLDKAMSCPLGDCVMHDTPEELNKHLEFMLRAYGDVLICGLGLGCVTRGTLANPAVKSVTVIENSQSVIDLVWPHMPKDERLKLVAADARQWIKQCRQKFDCAWHDLWVNQDECQDHLQSWHMELICELAGKVDFQGAWEFPRYFRRRMEFAGVI